MRITFEDKSYIEIERSKSSSKIIISISAKDYDNPNTTIINSVEINDKEFKELINTIINE